MNQAKRGKKTKRELERLIHIFSVIDVDDLTAFKAIPEEEIIGARLTDVSLRAYQST